MNKPKSEKADKPKTTVVTRKIQLLFTTQDKEKYKEHWSVLRDISYAVYKTANKIVNFQLLNDAMIDGIIAGNKEVKAAFSEKKSTGRKLAESKVKEVYGCSIQNSSYRAYSKESGLPYYVFNALNSSVCSYYNADRKDVLAGKSSIRTYKNGMPIPFLKPKMKFYQHENDIFFEWLKGLSFVLAFGRDCSNNRTIVEKIINGEYAACDSSIQIKDGKIFLLLVVKIPQIKADLDPAKVVGVDLGLNVPAYMALNEGRARQAIGSRDGFLKPRVRIQAQRRSLQKSLKFTKGGKGRKKKLERLEKLTAAERNTVKTLNHKISKEVIDFALRNGAGTIHLENLSGIAQDEKSKFILRNWSYYELQQFIEYKAKKAGITVNKISPAYTSQVCSCCGEKGNRKTQADFYCTNENCKEYGERQFADYNAAKNIARLKPGESYKLNLTEKELLADIEDVAKV